MANKILTITSVNELKIIIDESRSKGKKIGFVPTMGALHSGHMTLVKHSVTENDLTVCSVFVNPTQFNEKSDLDSYPRTLEADTLLLETHKADIVFAPSVDEVYPNGEQETIDVDLEGLDNEMEGAFRPGHFAGVVQVVHRLVCIVNPHNLYMGQKDFQQFTIIAKMLDNLNMECSLRVVPIVRAESGLALSSRNVRLTPDHMNKASQIYSTLKAVNRKKYKLPISELEKYALQRLGKIDGFRPEYFMIADGYTLKPIKSVDDSKYIVACTAVWAGDVRLIDNMIYRKPRGLKIFVK